MTSESTDQLPPSSEEPYVLWSPGERRAWEANNRWDLWAALLQLGRSQYMVRYKIARPKLHDHLIALVLGNLADRHSAPKRSLLKQAWDIPNFQEAFATGVSARRSRDPELAIVALHRSVELAWLANSSGAIQALVTLAAAYRDIGDARAARRIYEAILLLNPEDSAAMVGMAAVLREGGEYEAGISLCESALALNPDNAYALNTLAAIHMDRGQLVIAESYFLKAANSPAPGFNHLASLRQLQKRYEERSDHEGSSRVAGFIASLDRGQSGV